MPREPTARPTYGLLDELDGGVVAAGVLPANGVGPLLVPRPNLSIVAWFTVPSAVMPTAVWYEVSAVLVALPNTPSAPPRTVTPAAMSAFCTSVTAVPRAPTFKPR